MVSLCPGRYEPQTVPVGMFFKGVTFKDELIGTPSFLFPSFPRAQSKPFLLLTCSYLILNHGARWVGEPMGPGETSQGQLLVI